MPNTISKTELQRACQILFHPDIHISIEFMRSMEPTALKVAYRQKALDTHPDRCQVLGLSEAEMNRRFKEVNLAYELLRPLIRQQGAVRWEEIFGARPCSANTGPSPSSQANKHQANTTTQSKENQKSSGEKSWDDHFYNGKLPFKELRIGQFLYYNGRLSWQSMIAAIVWQKRHRPLFGQIARQWGMLTPEGLQQMLQERSYSEKIGEVAVRRGYLTPFQVMAIMGRQRMLQPHIGEYWIRRQILTPIKLDEMVRMMQRHNFQVRRAQMGGWASRS